MPTTPTFALPYPASTDPFNVPSDLQALASAVEQYLVPVGSVLATIRATAPTGYLFHNQAVASADTLYPALWAIAPAAWKSGTTLNIPNLADSVLIQQGVTALGATGGANSRTIASGNLPVHTHVMDHDHPAVTSASGSSHSHAIDHDHASVTSGLNSVDHSHTFSGTTSDPGNHQHNDNSAAGDWLMSEFGSPNSLDLHDGGGALAYGTTNITAAAGAHTHTYSGTTSGISANHTHAVDLPNFTGSSGSEASHTHSVDVAAFTGNTGNGGFANSALDTTPKHLAVNFIIKAA